MNWYLWSSLIALILHLSFMGVDGASHDDKKKAPSSEQRQARQANYRGTQKFIMPEYLRPDAYAQTVYSNDQRGADGSFNYEYQTDNGIRAKQESTGYGADKVVRGFYSHIGPDGKQYTVNYIADRFGYRAYGDHLPNQPSSYNEQPQNYYSGQYINSPRPAPSNLYNHRYHQHHTQTSFVPADTLQSQNIYVTEQTPNHYINITPKPFTIVSSPQLPVNILPPYNNYVQPHHYQNQPIAWTTPRPYESY